MKFISLLILLLSLNVQARDIDDFITVGSDQIQDIKLGQIEVLARDLIRRHKLSRHPNSCGDVTTLKGPTDPQSKKTLHRWINGIAHEMAAVNLAEKLRLRPIPLKFHDIQQKIMLLADRNSQYFDGQGVDSLSKLIFAVTHLDPKNYYFLFGDYLDGKTGWMTAVVLVKLSSGEAILIANTNDCF